MIRSKEVLVSKEMLGSQEVIQANAGQTFVVIGLDDSVNQWLCPEVLQIIREGECFSGGVRHRELVSHLLPAEARWIDITVPLEDAFEAYRQEKRVIVFTSGDPLFSGFGTTIKKRIPEAEIQVFPFFNSLQVLAHRLLLAYEDMRVVSLTGRPWEAFDRALIEQVAKIGLLTDRKKTPQAIAQRMMDYGYHNYTMVVGEHLGNKQLERVRSFSLKEVSDQVFEYPNNVLLTRSDDHSRPRLFGIPDDQFELLNGRAKMITKAPIRLITLSTLELYKHRSFWDIGFCTGSISIEAKLQFPHLRITAFEIRPEGERLMEINSRRFGAPDITTVIGDFTQTDLSAYPLPDAVFIGGHGGKLKEIIQKVRSLLLPEGVLVFNSVSPESKQEFIEISTECGFIIRSIQKVSVNDFNPIEIIQAILLPE